MFLDFFVKLIFCSDGFPIAWSLQQETGKVEPSGRDRGRGRGRDRGRGRGRDVDEMQNLTRRFHYTQNILESSKQEHIDETTVRNFYLITTCSNTC